MFTYSAFIGLVVIAVVISLVIWFVYGLYILWVNTRDQCIKNWHEAHEVEVIEI
jgi:uncharacterized membrane protein